MRSPKAGSTFDGGELRTEHDPLKAGTCCATRADEWGFFFGLFGGGENSDTTKSDHPGDGSSIWSELQTFDRWRDLLL